MVRDHWRMVWAGLLGGALILSVLFYVLTPRPLQARVLFFPTATNRGVVSELHFLPRSGETALRVKRLVESALAGPLSLKFMRIAPPESRVLAVFMKNDTAYVDLSAEFQFGRDDCPLDPLSRLAVLQKLIKFNESQVSDIVFLIEGKEVVSLLPSNPRKS